MELTIMIGLAAASLIGFIMGMMFFFKKKTAIFNQLIVCALGCFFLGRIFELILYLVTNEVRDTFHLGYLAVMGGFAFIFSSSFGQMDGLIDDKTNKFLKYRLIALIIPLILIISLVPVYLQVNQLEIKIIVTLVLISIMASSYYNFKHLIFPDVDYGIVKSIFGHNLLALILGFTYTAQLISKVLDISIIYYLSSFIMMIIYVIMIPVLLKGSKKWTI